MRRVALGLSLALTALSCGVGETAAATKILIYGCTSDRLVARIQVTAPLGHKPAIESAFRALMRGKTSQALLSLKQRNNEQAGLKALADLTRLSAGKLPEQNPAAVARSIAVNKRTHVVRQYCGG